MLGFSEQPSWWEEIYGPAPYTKNNLILWEDLENGHIRQGERAGRYDRYKRPGLARHVPVDGDGNLLSPLERLQSLQSDSLYNMAPLSMYNLDNLQTFRADCRYKKKRLRC
jgi:hypothetical protein